MTDASSATTGCPPPPRRTCAARACLESGEMTAGGIRLGASALTAGDFRARCPLPASRMTAPKEHGHG